MQEKILQLLAEICDDEIVKIEKDVDLFDVGLLDSMAFTELLVEIENRFNIDISPTEIERKDMNTANKIIYQIMLRVKG